MLKQIEGLHHITSLASDAAVNNAFFTGTLGLRRVKKTVNFDSPDVYHLYYGNEVGTPGTVMTYFPFPHIKPGNKGAGEAGTVAFSVPHGSLPFWQARFSAADVKHETPTDAFGEKRLDFEGPDGDAFALVEVDGDTRAPWVTGDASDQSAVRGFHSTRLRVGSADATKELLQYMNYQLVDRRGNITRMMIENGNGAHLLDIEEQPGAPASQQGGGSVHHIAFAVADRTSQLEVRKALTDAGYAVTPVIDRDYFLAIYFRTPDGILFEVATNEPGFDRDEPVESLGQTLKLPTQHEHLRPNLEATLQAV